MAPALGERAFSDALERARAFGWSELALPLDECLRIGLATGLDVVPTRPGDPAIGVLRAVIRQQARRRSLSAIAGLEPLPMHTDGAFLRRPPDYTLLETAAALEDEDTLVLPLRGVGTVDDDLRQGVFAVVGRGAPFGAHAIDSSGRLRFDPGCMRPRDPLARQAGRRLMASQQYAHRYSWRGTPRVLVIDNRQTLHGRSAVRPESARQVRRVMFRSHM